MAGNAANVGISTNNMIANHTGRDCTLHDSHQTPTAHATAMKA
jgi:hypothetical protein